MWIAKDKNGTIKLFESKPHRLGDWWLTAKPKNKWMQLDVPVSIQIEWEDDPVEVELVIKEL